jgi:hypothetical protein
MIGLVCILRDAGDMSIPEDPCKKLRRECKYINHDARYQTACCRPGTPKFGANPGDSRLSKKQVSEKTEFGRRATRAA